MKIKWLRLKRICERILRRSVEIHGSTSLHRRIRAAVLEAGGQVDIAVNLAFAKTLQDVIDDLAHEITHIDLQTQDDENPAFQRRWQEIKEEITRQYKTPMASIKGPPES